MIISVLPLPQKWSRSKCEQAQNVNNKFTKLYTYMFITGFCWVWIENIKFSKEGTLEGTKGWSGNFAHNKKVFNWSGKFYFKELENLNLGTG